MSSDSRRELIPRNATLHLIGSLDALQSRLRSAAEQTHLLDDAGRVPATPSYAELLQHAAEAQALSRDILQLTADFARSSHSTTRAGTAVLAHLATAATISSHAAPAFAETAEVALSLPRSAGPTDRQHSENRMVIDHATARAYLLRSSDSLRHAAKELNDHLDIHRFFRSPRNKARRLHHPGRAVATDSPEPDHDRKEPPEPPRTLQRRRLGRLPAVSGRSRRPHGADRRPRSPVGT